MISCASALTINRLGPLAGTWPRGARPLRPRNWRTDQDALGFSRSLELGPPLAVTDGSPRFNAFVSSTERGASASWCICFAITSSGAAPAGSLTRDAQPIHDLFAICLSTQKALSVHFICFVSLLHIRAATGTTGSRKRRTQG